MHEDFGMSQVKDLAGHKHNGLLILNNIL